MNNLKDIITDSAALAAGLRANGELHISYKMYTSIERALAVIVTGEIFLSNGSRWNDTYDREMMKAKNSFGVCMSCSTSENIAMWMLYSGEHGKRGAMLDFPRSVMTDILKSRTLELGTFNSRGTFEAKHELTGDDFEIFLTDVLYTDECKNGRLNVTLRDDHATVDKKVLKNKDIFHKNYGWSYEKECRLIVKLSDDMTAAANKEHLGAVRIKLSPASKRKMSEDRLYRSPVFAGGVSAGKESALTGGIEWDV